jgi:hypothetical protein
MTVERYKPEYFGDPRTMPTELLIESLKASYTPETIPPCSVCGGKLSIGSVGGGHRTIWACSAWDVAPADQENLYLKPGRELADKHYNDSRWQHTYDGDSRVLEFIRRFEEELMNLLWQNRK